MGSLSLMGSTLQTRELTPFTQVTVRSGDTLTGIARRMNVSRKSIMDLNDGLDPSHLKIGQKN